MRVNRMLYDIEKSSSGENGFLLFPRQFTTDTNVSILAGAVYYYGPVYRIFWILDAACCGYVIRGIV